MFVCVCVYVCVCVFIKLHITAQFGPVILVVIPFILDVRLVDVPAGVAQEEGHAGYLDLSSAVLALIFLKNSAVPFPCRP